ncbi:finger nhl-1-like [Octopus vulgaris]|uniref:Finger nhl-1-like n=1 Tax=Octopus vulgaris TaxID=6645 RepID=A0AA36B3Y2_OCTVU|nr:finger nhl-1-like [Octopus vulgaris]
MTDLVYAAEQVQQLLRCAICLDRFRQPKLLPCQHTFCESPCLEGLVDYYTRRIKCPECRLEHRVPIAGTSGFPNNLTIISFLELPQQPSTATSLDTPSLAPAGSDVVSSTPQPTQVPSTPVDSTPSSLSLPVEPRVPSNHAMCSDCGRMTVLSTCSHCTELTCETCRHSHISNLKQDMSRQLQRIRRLLPNVSESLTSVEHRREQLQRMCNSVNDTVSETIDNYMRELKARHDYLLSEIDTFHYTELNALQTYQENLEMELTTIASFCDSTEPLLTQREDIEASNVDLPDIKRQLQEHISTLQNQSTLELPSARQLTLQADGSQLGPAINHFGELMVLLHSSPSSYLRNSILGPSDSTRGTNLREYNESRRQSLSGNGSSRTANDNASSSALSSNLSGSLLQESSKPAATQASSNPHNSFDIAYGAAGATASSAPLQNAALGPSGTSTLRDPASFSDNVFERDSKYSKESQRNQGDSSSSKTSSGSDENRGRYGKKQDTYGGAKNRTRTEYSSTPHAKNRSLFSNDDDEYEDDGGRLLAERDPMGMRPPRDSHGSQNSHYDRYGASNELVLYEDNASAPLQRRSLPNSPILAHRNMEMNPVDLILPAALTWHPRSDISSRYNGFPRNPAGYYSQNTLPITFNWRDLCGYSEQMPRGQILDAPPHGNHKAISHSQSRHPDIEESSSSTDNGASVTASTRKRRSIPQSRFDNHGVADSSDDDDGDNSAGTPGPGHRHCKSASTLVTQARNNYRAKSRSWTRFGEHGNEESQFISPRGVAASEDDEIYVCDSSNHRVEVFDNTGIFLHSFGSYGQGNGQFDCVADVAVNQFGNIAVTDRYNNRIQLFDRHGCFQSVIGSAGHGDGELSYPWGIAWDNMGFLYTCDKDNNRIQVFQANGNFVRNFGGPGRGHPSKFDSPYYLAVSPDSLLYVSDCNNHRIQVFSFYGDFLFSFGHEGSNNGQFKYPKGISIDEQGFVLVADSGNNRMQVFRGDGTFYASFGSGGDQAHNFNGPEGVAAMNNSCIVVTDRDNHRVQLF